MSPKSVSSPAFPPALTAQRAMAAQRAAVQTKPDDVSSQASWSVLTEPEAAPKARPPVPEQHAQTEAAQSVWDQAEEDKEDEPPAGPSAFFQGQASQSSADQRQAWAGQPSAAGIAPATQAAKNLLGNKIKHTSKLA